MPCNLTVNLCQPLTQSRMTFLLVTCTDYTAVMAKQPELDLCVPSGASQKEQPECIHRARCLDSSH